MSFFSSSSSLSCNINTKHFLLTCVVGTFVLQALLIVTYEQVFPPVALDHHPDAVAAYYIPQVFQTQQRHCDVLLTTKNNKTNNVGRGDVLIVDVNLEHALSTANDCFGSSSGDRHQKVTILIVVEKIPRWLRPTTVVTDHLVKVEQPAWGNHNNGNNNDSLPGHVVWYAQIGQESPPDLLNFGPDLQALFMSQVESAAIVGNTSSSSSSKSRSIRSTDAGRSIFDTIWIRSPCEPVHDDVNKTPQFALKLHEFVHAWELVLASHNNHDDDQENNNNNQIINWIIEECEKPEYTTTLLHNSVMFRPSELLQQHQENVFSFGVDLAALRHRYDLFRRNQAFLGVEQLNQVSKGAATTKTESCRAAQCRYAYMTLLHSDGKYVCGALVMGHSIRKHDTTNDLVALVTPDTPQQLRAQLDRHGWIVVDIHGIHGPPGTPEFFEFNFSKLRAWKVAHEMGYDKVAVVDSDLLFEKDPSVLFHSQTAFAAVPQSTTVFNGGLLVFEPSTWLHDYMVRMIDKLGVPYAYAEQSFLNQIFGWRMHLFDETDVKWKKNSPGPHTPKHFMIHYFGFKPWHCPSREADCNTLEHMRIRNNDFLFHHWFDVHDEMSEACANVPEHHPQGFLMTMIGPLVRVIAR